MEFEEWAGSTLTDMTILKGQDGSCLSWMVFSTHMERGVEFLCFQLALCFWVHDFDVLGTRGKQLEAYGLVA